MTSQEGTHHPSGCFSEYLTVMADGTVKQRHPISDNEVWTVPGRSNRPLGLKVETPQPLDPAAHGTYCAFCENRYLETPPEKSRLIRNEAGDWQTLPHVPAEELSLTTAEFRCIPNLFEILSYDYWHLNHRHQLSPADADRRLTYLASPTGRDHVLTVARNKLRASGRPDAEVAALDPEEVIGGATGFFGGGHDVIVARRHFTDGATDTSQLASAGTLTPDEHRRYIQFTVEALERLFATIPVAKHVAVFQNWLKPAGASFDHLHKQLVAIDEYGLSNQRALTRELQQPGFFNARVVGPALEHGLVLAANDHALAFAGFGHRYPTIKIMSTSPVCDPWRQSCEELAAVSDLLHAMHAASGPEVPCNEEWHQRPARIGVPMPWHINLKWRISTLAGFEGGTKINLNTIDPFTIRQRVLPRLHELRDQGRIAAMQLGDECMIAPEPLLYRQDL